MIPVNPTLVTFDAIRSAAVASSSHDGPQSSLLSQRNSVATPSPPPIEDPRSHVFHLGVQVGQLCQSILTHSPLDPPRPSQSVIFPDSEDVARKLDPFWSKPSPGRDEIARIMGSLFVSLFCAAVAFGLDLRLCILKKVELNGRKYPVELCKGKSGKYTQYSTQTGITRTSGQSSVDTSPTQSVDNSFDSSTEEECSEEKYDTETIDGVTALIRQFAINRLWSRYHTPRSLALALMGELGELAELFQWRGDDSSLKHDEGKFLVGWDEREVEHVEQELADVTIYLIRLADVCGVKLGVEAMHAIGAREL